MSIYAAFEDIPRGRYGAIVADPPWSFRTWSAKGKNRSPDWLVDDAERHYRTMSLPEIRALPVERIAAPDAVLFLWVVDCLLPEAINCAIGWGFTYKTVAFTWVKTTANGDKFPIGMGYWTRGNPETCLLFTRGRPRRCSAAVRQLIVSPRREHSRKPEETAERIERLVPGPYVELFARHARDGWDCWGDQLPPSPELTRAHRKRPPSEEVSGTSRGLGHRRAA